MSSLCSSISWIYYRTDRTAVAANSKLVLGTPLHPECIPGICFVFLFFCSSSFLPFFISVLFFYPSSCFDFSFFSSVYIYYRGYKTYKFCGVIWLQVIRDGIPQLVINGTVSLANWYRRIILYLVRVCFLPSGCIFDTACFVTTS